MSEMLGRVTTALQDTLERMSPDDREYLYPHAMRVLGRAAIEAMREPTRTIIDSVGANDGTDYDEMTAATWRKMIEAALSEEKAPA